MPENQISSTLQAHIKRPKEVQTKGLGTVTHHPRFYFPDGNIIFLVDNVLFKIHRYFFERDSPVFSSMFTLPPPQGDIAEGGTDEKPVELTGFTSADFEQFLIVLYPMDFATCEITGKEAWISVVKIATQFEFSSIRTLAIARLRALISTATERIAVGKRYDISTWLAAAYTELCIVEHPLSMEQGQMLGLEDVIEIYRLRSMIRYSSNLKRHHDSIRALICKEFKLDG